MRKLLLLSITLFAFVNFNTKAQCDTKLTGFIITGSGQANTNEAMSKAFDGNTKTKWCDSSSPEKFLELIFNNPVEICKMRLHHAQVGGESAAMNTSDYKIQAYSNGEWINVVTVTGNTLSTTEHEPSPFKTIALRLQIDKPSQTTEDKIARIYEFEIYGKPASAMESSTPLRRVYPLKVTGSSQKMESEAMLKAFDGDTKTKWCATNTGEKYLTMFFNDPVKLSKVIIHHAGVSENANYNTKNFKFQAKVDGAYSDIINVTGNTSNVSTHTYTGDIASDEIRFLISQAEQSSNGTARIPDIEMFASYNEVTPVSSVESGDVVEIFPFAGNKIVSVENSSLENNAKMRVYTQANVNAQRWIVSESEGKFNFQNAYTGKYLSPNAIGMVDVIQKQNSSKTTLWTLTPVAGKENSYYIINSAGLYLTRPLDIEGSQIFVCKLSDDPVRMGQVWKFAEAPAVANEFTSLMRDEIMDTWKAKYYMPASFSPAFKLSNTSTYTGHVIERPGFWDTAENMEIMLDAYETTKNDEYRIMYNEVFDNFCATQYVGGDGWKRNDFNDDLAWLVIGMVRAHLLFGDQGSGREYKKLAKEYFDIVYNRALFPEGHCSAGLLRWKERDEETKDLTNSCINGPMEVAACYVAIATGDDSYYTKAKNLYELQRKYLTKLPQGVGQVYDSKKCTEYNYWASTYNQGTFLGAATMLYNRYGDSDGGKATTYKADAQKVIDYSTGTNMCDINGILSVCQSGADLVGFKGILMRYIRKYIEEMPGINADTYKSWLEKNILHAYNNRNSQSVSWSAWLEKSSENNYRPYMDNGKIAHQIYGAFGTGTIVSAAVNVPDPKNPQNDIDISINTDENYLLVTTVGKQLFISSEINNPIQKIDIYDLHGRLLFSQSGLNISDFEYTLSVEKTVLIVKIQTGSFVKSKKIIIK